VVEATQTETDGRRRRSLDSRARIVAAMLDLVREGDMSPGAETVAARAEVGLRTVFRHFKDMDSLYREMSRAIEDRVAREIDLSAFGGDWPQRLDEMIRRRGTLFELITPFKRAEAAQRHRSRFLEQDVQALNLRLRALLMAMVPPELAADRPRLEALDLLLSFEAWDRLRREQALSVETAQAVLRTAATSLLK
jgi:AcrR family transcriptional regulator